MLSLKVLHIYRISPNISIINKYIAHAAFGKYWLV